MSDSDQQDKPSQEPITHFKRGLTVELDRLFDESTLAAARNRPRKPQEQPPQITITNFGPIKAINLPPAWVENTAATAQAKTDNFRVFYLSSNATVRMCLFARSQQISSQAAANFRAILSKPNHYLTGSELKSIAEVLRETGDPKNFRFLQSSTQDLHSKKVLFVEGRLIEKEHDVHAVYIDVDGKGAVIAEIYYVAPKLLYPRYLLSIKNSIQSISWQ